jgi:SAM-dependent methyltransferase
MHASSIIEEADGRTGAADPAQGMRAHLHGMWAAVAPAWGEHADFTEMRAAALTARMLELTAPQPGERVLELACGAGGLGLAAAELVGAGGEVVLSDVAAPMTAVAAARAAAQGVQNVRCRELDLEDITEPDGSYDVVLCREGLMFATDPARGAREIRRVLRPGGRVAVAVWAAQAHNPWLALVFDAVAAQLGRPVPPPGIPGPFSLCDAEQLGELLRDAGLADVAVHEVELPLRAGSFDAWWTRTSALAGPLAGILAALPAPAVEAIVSDLRGKTRAYETGAGLEFSGRSLLATGGR